MGLIVIKTIFYGFNNQLSNRVAPLDEYTPPVFFKIDGNSTL
jgi:hypothetical protein